MQTKIFIGFPAPYPQKELEISHLKRIVHEGKEFFGCIYEKTELSLEEVSQLIKKEGWELNHVTLIPVQLFF
jgi:hypothetical protein